MTETKSNTSVTNGYPDYISKTFLEKSLKNGLNTGNIVITDFEISMGSLPGDNYCSDIYRAKIVYTKDDQPNNSISLIIKAMPFNESRSPTLDALNVFNKEVKMYTDTIPKISKILHDEFMGARLFYAVKEPVQLIAFEDLKPLGFQMADRQSGIDEAHCRLVLSKLGRFHAASIVLAERDKYHMETYSFGLFKENRDELIISVFEKGLLSCAEEVSNWKGFENIAKKMNNLSDNFLTNIANHCNSTASIKVLNHGDLWVNNFLFKYDEGTPIDVVFVDYQMSFFSSPGIDINYFMSTSPTNTVRKNKYDALIEEYYNNFEKVLSRSSCKHYSIDAMKKEINSRQFYGFAASIGITPLVMMDNNTSKDSSLENFADEDASARLRKAMYGSTNYRVAMEFMLRKFDESKVLENVS